MVNFKELRERSKEQRRLLGLTPPTAEEQNGSFFSASALLWTILLAGAIFVAGCIICTPAHAYTDEQIVSAIGKAENSKKFPYGIKSVACNGEAECRQICLNSVRNARKRWIKAGKPEDFIVFMSRRYCPVGAKDDPNGLNKNWVKNVKAILRRDA